MKLFLISQKQSDDYDTFNAAVVAAPDEETARQMHPGTGDPVEDWEDRFSSWCSGPKHVVVELIGEAADDVKQGVVCAAYNAG